MSSTSNNRDLFSELNMSSFTIDNSGRQFYHEIKRIGKASGWKPSHLNTKCKIVAIDGKITFQMPGIETYVTCKHIGEAKSEVYYSDLYEAIRDNKSTEISFLIQEKTLIIDERKLSCSSKFINSEGDLTEEGLGVLNFGGSTIPSNTSSQQNLYTLPENNKPVHLFEVQSDVFKAMALLRKYGVEPESLMALVTKKLGKG